MGKKLRVAVVLNYSEKKIDACLSICGVGQREAGRRSESYPLSLKTPDMRSKSCIQARWRKLRC